MNKNKNRKPNVLWFYLLSREGCNLDLNNIQEAEWLLTCFSTLLRLLFVVIHLGMSVWWVVYVCLCVCMYACMYACVNSHSPECVFLPTLHVYFSVYVCVFACTCACVCACVRVCTCRCQMLISGSFSVVLYLIFN